MQTPTFQAELRTVSPEGPLTRENSERIKGELLADLRGSLGRFVLDASEMAFIDSRGLEVLCEVAQEMSNVGLTLKLCAVNETVREILELTELGPLFEYYKDANAAARSFL